MKTLRRLMGLILVITCGVLVATAKVPPWWITRGVINTNLPPNNYGPVNLGQLKHVAKQAYWEMEAKLPNGAGDTLGDLVFGFAQKTNANYLPINLGQLKYVAKPFYDRLIQEGYTQSYPWTQTQADDNNYAAANLGQLKYLFSFDLDNPNPPQLVDSDGDGLNDAWELEHFGNLDPLPDEDPDGDGIPNSEEEQNETDPKDPNPADPEDIPSYAMVDFGLEGQGLKINEAGDLVGRKGTNYFTIHKGQVKQWPGMMINDLNEKGDILLTPMDNGKGYTTIYHLKSGEVIELGEWDLPVPSDSILQNPYLISYSYQGLKTKLAYALNASRQVVGFIQARWSITAWYLDENDQYQEYTDEGVDDPVPMLWSQNGGHKINFSPDYGYWADGQDGFSINEQGSFVAGWYNNLQGNNTIENCHYWSGVNASAQVLDLDAGFKINSQGQIAGQKNQVARLLSADGSTDLVLGPGYATSVNDDGNVLVNNYEDKAFVVRKNPETQKYEKFALTQALPEDDSGQITMANDITKNGLIAGQVLKEGQKKAVAIFPAELGVDANRDGRITLLNEKELPENASYEVDRTTEGKYFRFWKNDDNDGTPNAENEYLVPDKDSDDSQILSRRDLEDFTRLWVYLKGVHEMVKGNDAMLVGLKWKDVSEGSPAIRLFEAVENDGGDNYLKNEAIATQQTQGKYGNAIEAMYSGNTILNSGETFILPSEIWENLDEDNYKKFFLFEGVSEGKGKLQLVFLDKNQNEIGEAPPIYLEIKDIKEMYERAYATPLDIPAPYDIGPYNAELVGFQKDNQIAFDKPEGEKDTCVVFVHGWRMTKEEAERFAETFFKRLWWQGYKGRVAAFRWETFTSPTSYNTSEHRAWKYGKGLQGYVNSLSSEFGSVNIAAHSMGNIVTGEALKRGMIINNYVMMQAAVPAGCYDESLQINSFFKFEFAEIDNPTPDSSIATNPGYRSYLKNVSGNLINFYNPDDYALVDGQSFIVFDTNWQANQKDYKPDDPLGSGEYHYDPQKPNGEKGWLSKLWQFDHFVTDPHESMAFVARPRSRAVGSEANVKGSVNEEINLKDSPYNFTAEANEHSAQFNRRNQQVYKFYQTLLEKLK